ncbi:hypothetical protein [Paenibacillus sp. NPDC058174]|uniref:hypothetical protein n=1 Tax=Paenibacillus sp. NPDC058174 TaxID=3346366 RepID=UPI0036DE12D2
MLAVFTTYVLLMIIFVSKGTLTTRSSVLLTAASVLIVGILYGIPKLYIVIYRKLYDELRRMMK